MKKKLFLLIPTCLISLSTLSSCSNKKGFYSFHYQSGLDDYVTSMYYDDSFFDGPASTYNNELSTASLSFSMASFASTRAKNFQDFSNRFRNSFELLNKLGFTDLWANEDYYKAPNVDTFGVTCGQKIINGQTLIAVGTRGANYGNEWASNMTLYEDEGHTIETKKYSFIDYDARLPFHKGFYDAATILLDSINSYITTYNIEGDVKIWISGYSRAGAAANIASGILDLAIVNNKVDEILGDTITLKKDNLYAYCFEAPQGVFCTYNDDGDIYEKGENFNNIFCVINKNDLVPYTAMRYLGFNRFGIELFLPDITTNIHYFDIKNQYIKQFKKMPNYTSLGGYTIDNFAIYDIGYNKEKIEKEGVINVSKYLIDSNNYINWSQGLYIDNLFNLVTDSIVEMSEAANYSVSEAYVIYFQEGLRQLFDILYSKGAVKDSLVSTAIDLVKIMLNYGYTQVLIDDILRVPSRLFNDLNPILQITFKRAGLDISPEIVEKTTLYLTTIITKLVKFSFQLVDFSIMATLFSFDNIRNLGRGHYPELTLSMVRCMDKNYTDNPFDYLEMVNDPGHYFLLVNYDKQHIKITSNNKIIAEFKDGKAVKINDTVAYSIVSVRTYNNDYQVYLPSNASYQVEFENPKTEYTLHQYNKRTVAYKFVNTELKDNILYIN